MSNSALIRVLTGQSGENSDISLFPTYIYANSSTDVTTAPSGGLFYFDSTYTGLYINPNHLVNDTLYHDTHLDDVFYLGGSFIFVDTEQQYNTFLFQGGGGQGDTGNNPDAYYIIENVTVPNVNNSGNLISGREYTAIFIPGYYQPTLVLDIIGNYEIQSTGTPNYPVAAPGFNVFNYNVLNQLTTVGMPTSIGYVDGTFATLRFKQPTSGTTYNLDWSSAVATPTVVFPSGIISTSAQVWATGTPANSSILEVDMRYNANTDLWYVRSAETYPR